jgi:hypothetical protein
MQRARLSAAGVSALTLAALLAGCASNKPEDKTAGWRPNRIQS